MKKIINSALIAISIREIKQFSRNSIMLAIFILAPIAYSLLIGFVYKDAKVTDLPIMLIDLDQSPLSDRIADALDENIYLKVLIIKQNQENYKDQIISEKLQAVITIPKGFQAEVEQKRHPEMNVEINGLNMLTANYASTGIMKVLASLNAGIEMASLQKSGIPSAIAAQRYESFAITTSRFYNPASNYLMFLWPGMLGTILQQVFLLTIALSFSKEYEKNTFEELFATTRNTLKILMGKAIPYWIIGLILWFPLIRVSLPAFHVPLVSNQLAYWLISALFVLSLTFFGIAISIAVKSQLKATEILMIIATPSFIISGQTWPIEQMPNWIRLIAEGIPLTHYLEAFRRLMLYQANLSNITPQIVGLLIITIVSFAASYFLLKKSLSSFKK